MSGPESAAMRMGAQAFEVWLAALLQHFSLPPAPKPLPGVVTLHFGDKPSIHIMGKAGLIDMMSEAGRLSAPYTPECLLDLLSLNRCYGTSDAVSVTVDRASGTVIVWARQRQQSLDIASAVKLIQALRERMDAVQKIIGRPTRQAAQRGAGTLARMLAMR